MSSLAHGGTGHTLMPRLDWFPKQYSQGDIDGTGSRRLLGQPNVPLPSVLVRETAQNSWDAKGTDGALTFVLNLRRLTEEQHRTLFGSVLTGGVRELGSIPPAANTWVLEIADRGTVGLGGPIRNDLARSTEDDSNFIDLIFNIGAPRDVKMGGGTYGFGKTISYVASRLGVVAFWSRCEHGGGLQHRFIASGMGDSFNQGGRRYTGRHWWGRSVDDDTRVEPILHEQAKVLGEALFERTFRAQETGTSMLVIDPAMPQGAEAFARDLANAAAWHLWPKLVADDEGRQPMRIDVQLNGQRVGPDEPTSHPVLSGMVRALKGVRAVQEGSTGPPGVTVREVRSARPNRLLGHLGLTVFSSSGEPEEEVEDEMDQVPAPAHHVALMRHEAELVVKYMAGPALGADDIQWAGVFKPVPATDDSFAASEPPAHDDWVPAGVPDKEMKRDVNVGLKRIRGQIEDFVLPQRREPGDRHTESGAALGESLSDLVGAAPGSTPRRQASRGGGAGGGSSSGPRVDAVQLGPAVDGIRRHAVRVSVPGNADESQQVELRVRIATEGGALNADGLVTMEGWLQDVPNWDVWEPTGCAALSVTTVGGQPLWAVLSAPDSVALDVSARSGVAE